MSSTGNGTGSGTGNGAGNENRAGALASGMETGSGVTAWLDTDSTQVSTSTSASGMTRLYSASYLRS